MTANEYGFLEGNEPRIRQEQCNEYKYTKHLYIVRDYSR